MIVMEINKKAEIKMDIWYNGDLSYFDSPEWEMVRKIYKDNAYRMLFSPKEINEFDQSH